MQTNQTEKRRKAQAQCGAVYGMGLIGALIYFVQHATTFWAGLLGILKAIVWPAILVYDIFGFLKQA